MRVPEVGAEPDYPFLKDFRIVGAECFSLNIHYCCSETEGNEPWVEATLGDMNRLPYADEVFDVILLSATSHHSPNLAVTISELARVSKPNGFILILNDPIKGIIKELGRWEYGARRDSLIHENEYTIIRYERAFRCNGLQAEYLFSAYHDKKLIMVRSTRSCASLGLGS